MPWVKCWDKSAHSYGGSMMIHRRHRRRASAAAVLATVVVASLTACGSDDDGGGGGGGASNAAAGDLPDVIGALPLGALRTLSTNELLDTDAVADVVDNLDAGTFSES